jgi:spermidine/putrescine transport system permease protein
MSNPYSWTRRGRQVLKAHLWLFFLFLYLPIGILFIYSFNANDVSMMTWSGFTFDWYLRVFENLGLISRNIPEIASGNAQLYSDPNLAISVINTLVVGFSATTMATVIGTLTAIGLDRARFFGKDAYRALVMLPIVIPDIVLGIATLVFLSSLGIPLGRMSVIAAHTLFLSSYVAIVVGARLAGMDRKLEEASADLGARPLVTFRRVTLPLLMPAIIGSYLLALVISFDDLVIAFFTSGVGSTTLPVYLFSAIKRNVSPEINAVSVLIVVVSMCVVVAAFLLRRDNAAR